MSGIPDGEVVTVRLPDQEIGHGTVLSRTEILDGSVFYEVEVHTRITRIFPAGHVVHGIAPMDENKGGRFWICDELPDTHAPHPFGDDTIGIVDEHEGGIVLYVHKDNAGKILNTLRLAHGEG